MDSSDLSAELYKSFVQLHNAQLKSNGIPEIYWNTLFAKLQNEVFSTVQLISFYSILKFLNKYRSYSTPETIFN